MTATAILNLSTPHGALGTNKRMAFTCCDYYDRLSTPHGALGTKALLDMGLDGVCLLSTPHGALGTIPILPLTLIPLFPPFNSTRCIRNKQAVDGTDIFASSSFQLHTVH